MESGLRDGLILSHLEQIQQAASSDEFEKRLLGLLSDIEARPLSFMEKDLLDGLLRAHEVKLRDGDALLSALQDRLRFGFWPQVSQLGVSSMAAQAYGAVDDKLDSSVGIRESSGRPSSSSEGTTSASASTALTAGALLPFVLRQPQESARFKCVVRRSRSGMRMVYRLYLQEHCTTDDMALGSSQQLPKETILMAARRAKSAKAPSLFSFWCSSHAKSWQEQSAVAQLRVVSPGVFVASPTSAPEGGSEGFNGPVLVHLTEGPDKVLLASALVAESAQMPEEMLISAWETFKTRSGEKNRQQLQLPSGLTVLNSRTPHKDSTYGVYTMRFDGEGRVKAPSRKNIVMDRLGATSSSQDSMWATDHVCATFQLGKMDDDTFSLDFGYPVSPFQAFAIAVAAFSS